MLITFAAKAQTQTYTYIDEDGDSQNATSVIDISGTITSPLSNGWYYVSSASSMTGDLEISGNVKLILDKDLTIDGKIEILSGSSLTIYGTSNLLYKQATLSVNDDIDAAGTLIINSCLKVDTHNIGSDAANISILGGQVSAEAISAASLTIGYKSMDDKIVCRSITANAITIAEGCSYQLDGNTYNSGELSTEEITNFCAYVANLNYGGIGKTSEVFEEGIFSYTILDDGTSVQVSGLAGGATAPKNLTIPSSVEHGGTTYPVTKIGGYAFSYPSTVSSNTNKITIPNTIVEIKEYAFANCGMLETVEVEGNGLKFIGDYAFYYISLKEITLPASIEFIGEGAFENCYNGNGLTVYCNAVNPPELGENALNAIYYKYYLYIPPCADYSNSGWQDFFGSKIYGYVPFDQPGLVGTYDKEFDGTVSVPNFTEKVLTPADGVTLTFTKLEFADPNVEVDYNGNPVAKPIIASYNLTYSANEGCNTTGNEMRLKEVSATITPHEITQDEIESVIKSRRTPITDDYYAYATAGHYDGSNNGKLDGNYTTNVVLFPENPAKTVKFRLNAYYVSDESSTAIVTSDDDAKYIHVETNTDGFWNNTDYETHNYAFPDSYNNFEGAIGDFQPYVERSEDETTLTFKYGEKPTADGTYYDLDGTDTWMSLMSNDDKKKVTTVVFDPSFKDAAPTSCSNWFSGCENLTEITGMEYLHTDNVTDMSYMFNHCEALQMVDLSKFNTSSVTNMESMFAGCIKMRMLDLTSFNTEKVTNMNGMFSLNSSQALYYTNLEVIYVGDGWKTDQLTDHTNMFYRNDKLVGGKGTKFDGSKALDKTFAKIDGGTDDPGYLTGIANYGYAVLNGNTLTFKQGSKSAEVDGETFELTQCNITYQYEYAEDDIRTATNIRPTWYNKRADIKNVVFEAGFKDVLVRNCSYWFHECVNLVSITGLTNLNTSQVTEMQLMFAKCKKLSTFDLSGFDTQNVHNFSSMFSGCTSLKTLPGITYITLNTTKYPNSSAANDERILVDGMFAHSGLKSINVSHWASTPVRSYHSLFLGCTALEDVNVTGIVTTETENLNNMFKDCSALGTDSDFPFNVSTFVTTNVTDMAYMFDNCSGLESIDVSKFDTKNVKDMSYMFDDCSSLSVLDISNFNTKNVTNMDFMFADCHNLTTIKVGSNWNTEKTTSSDNMFQGDYNLIGNYGAMVDVSKYNPGSFYTNDVAKANCTEPDGYLTTGDYKIFYDLDKDDDELVLETIDDAPASFAGGAGVASLPELEERAEGDAFKGWHRATQNSEGEMTFATDASSAIASNEVGNRIYAAEWTLAKEKYVLYDADTKTLTFHFDTKKPETGAYSLNEGAVAPDWLKHSDEIEKIIIADQINPTSCYQWFKGFSKLTALDLRNLKTSNVTNMTSMFNGCSNLTGILIGDNWSTDNVTESDNMFTDCTSLIGEGGEFASQYGDEDKTYAYAEDEYGNYGLLTKDNFKIFYTLNDIEETGGDGNATFSNGGGDDNSMIVPCSDDEATTLETPTWEGHIFSGWSKVTAYIYNSESDSYEYVYDTEEPLHQKSVSPGSGNMVLYGLWDKNYSITLPGADWEVIDENGNAIENPTASKGATIIIRYKGSKVVKKVEVETTN